jgi:hypothetical protein
MRALMRVGAIVFGAMLLLLLALRVGVAEAFMALLLLAPAAGGVAIVLAFATRVRREAQASAWEDDAPLEGRDSDTLRPPRDRSTSGPYLLGAAAIATVIVGAAAARHLDGAGSAFQPPASVSGPVLPTAEDPLTPTASPPPQATPTFAVTSEPLATATPEPTLDLAGNSDDEDDDGGGDDGDDDKDNEGDGDGDDDDEGDDGCPPGRERRGRC